MQQRSPLVMEEGRFSEDGQSFVIPRPDVPHPLVNVISLGAYGVAVSQTGAGCSWGRHPSEPVTRGSALFTRDAGGRSLYLRDDRTERSWSVGWQPLRARPRSYECIHGVGYSLITSQTEGVQAQWLVFVPYEEPLEVWRVRLRNLSGKPRALSLWTGVEWAAGRAAAGDEKTFVHDDGRILLAKAGPSTAGSWGGVFFHGTNLPARSHTLDRRGLWGPYGSPEAPEALKRGRHLAAENGREPFAGLCVSLTLKPGEERSMLFTVGCAQAQSEALLKARKFQDFVQVDHAWNRTQMFWDRYLSGFTVETPDASFNLLVNTWLKYQAMSQGLWGGWGPRDARVFLPLEPERVRREILSRAGGARLSVAKALPAFYSDVPWPALLTSYVRETGDGRLLTEKLGAAGRTLYGEALRSLKELASSPSSSGSSWLPELLAEAARMIAWAVEEEYLPARERASSAKLKRESGRLAHAGGNGRVPSIRSLEEACRAGKSREAWEIYRALAPLPPGAPLPAIFTPDTAGPVEASPSELFRASAEGILGVRPEWEGLRVRPCLPPTWRSARVRREFRGASYDIRIRRDAKRPAGFLSISFNGRRVSGDLLPPAFDRKNEVQVTVGRAK